MPQATATVPEYCQGLTKSRLLSGERVSMLYNVWLARAAGSDADVDGFRKFLISGRHLTDYQAALIQRGHTDGFLVGGYVILDRIGKGQTAGVYKAVHPASGQVVALKVLPGSRAKNPTTLARFQREGRLLTQLDHANVVRAFQVGNAGNVHFIVMEHLDGETLDEVLSRRKMLPYAEAVRIIVQALQGLQHLHDQRLIHRDLKPANLIMVPGYQTNTLQSTVKILDVGLGRELFDEDSPEPEITTEGTMLGTPDYLAPEQARDARTADIRADIYSLGCVLFHLVSGRPPFPEKNLMAAMVRHATEPPPAPEGVPTGLSAVLSIMMAKKANDRFGVPAEAAEALAPYLPDDAAPAAESRIIPAYTQWLKAETASPSGSTRLNPRLSGPVSSARIRTEPAAPQRPSGPVSGSRLRTGLAAPAEPSPTFTPPTLKPPTAPPRPAPHLVKPAEPGETDVELVALDEMQAKIVYTMPQRPLWHLDRRDFIMLGLGSGIVIGAIAVGIFAAKFNASKIRRGPEED